MCAQATPPPSRDRPRTIGARGRRRGFQTRTRTRPEEPQRNERETAGVTKRSEPPVGSQLVYLQGGREVRGHLDHREFGVWTASLPRQSSLDPRPGSFPHTQTAKPSPSFLAGEVQGYGSPLSILSLAAVPSPVLPPKFLDPSPAPEPRQPALEQAKTPAHGGGGWRLEIVAKGIGYEGGLRHELRV